MIRCLLGAAVLLAAAASAALAASAAHVTGTIKGFECGDNCYLTLATAKGEVTGLCEAKACQPWNEATKLPRRLLGSPVVVTMGTGQQIDGSGNVMGEFPAFTNIEPAKGR